MRSMSVFVAPEDEASSFWKRGLKDIVVVVVVVVVVVKKRIIIIIIINNIYIGIGYTLDRCIFARTTDEATPQSRAFLRNVSQCNLSAKVRKHRTWTPATRAWSLMIRAMSAIGAVSTLSVASTTDLCNRLKALTGRCSKSDRWMRHGVELQRWAQTSRFFVTLSLSCLQAGLAAALWRALGSK